MVKTYCKEANVYLPNLYSQSKGEKGWDQILIKLTLGFLGSSAGKEFTCNVRDLGSIPGFGRSPGGGHGNSLQYSCLENPHGQRNLVGYNPWGHKESDTTELLSMHAMSQDYCEN